MQPAIIKKAHKKLHRCLTTDHVNYIQWLIFTEKDAYKYSDIRQENTLKNKFTLSFSQIQTPLGSYIAQVKLALLYVFLYPDRISCIFFSAPKNFCGQNF
jgi:hypothetical protein